LEKHGHQVKLMDSLVEGHSVEQSLRLIGDFSPELTVIYVSTASLKSDAEIAELIKGRTGSRIVLVGPWCGVDPDMILNSSKAIDAIALYEFDYTILEMADGMELKDIKGLWWRNGEQIMRNQERPPVTAEQLNEFPFVTDVYRRHLNIRKYFQAPQLYPFVDLFTGRSCAWGKCTFCLWPFTMTKGAPYRKRKIENVLEELKFIKKELPYVKEVFLQDDTLPADRAKELSAALLNNKLKITWSCYARAELDHETLKLMRAAGCRGLHVGYESSDPGILKLMNKGITVEQMERFTSAAYGLGFIIHADFIIGLPGETVDTIKATIAWAKRLKVHSYQFVTPKAYKNTPLYAWLKKHENAEGGKADPNKLTEEDLRYWVKRAIRECHMNLPYLIRLSKHPSELGRLIKSAFFVLKNVL
jgi:anaerobic magnesium-protoporphyrin IX monomethyl ester cyclase